MIRDNVPTVLSIQVIRHIFPTFGYHEASRRLCRVALTARAASRFRFSPCPVTGDKHLLSMNRKEERLLTPALPSTEEGREKRARRRFRGSMREWFRGNLSPALSSLGRNRGRRGHRAGYRAQCTHKVRGSLSSIGWREKSTSVMQPRLRNSSGNHCVHAVNESAGTGMGRVSQNG